MKHHFEASVLYDFYKSLLTEKQREAYDLYYNDDLTMEEIAEETGTTRQAVSLLIKASNKRLEKAESDLKMVSNYYKMENWKEDFQTFYNKAIKRSDCPDDVKNELFALISDLESIER